MIITRPSTALFLRKKRMRTSFQKLWAAKLVSTAISAALSFRANSASVNLCSGYSSCTACVMAAAVLSPPSRIAFSAISVVPLCQTDARVDDAVQQVND